MTTGAIIHVEFPTRNARESSAFYAKLFGWQIQHDVALNYTMWSAPDGSGGGFTNLSESVQPGDVLVYVQSEDIEADLKRAEALGGQIVQQKSEIPETGWFGVFKDPTGNSVALYTSMRPPG